MKKHNKKGFTIVELVIVIAVIAILAAVLIPTFSNVIRKAQISADTQVVRNLNTALKTDEATEGKPATMADALAVAADAGYDVAKINATATGNEILWDSVNNVFCYLNDNNVEYIPETEVSSVQNYQRWVIAETVSDTYSTYYVGNDVAELDAVDGLGLDTGNANVGTVYYGKTGEAYSSDREVVIRTNNGGNIVVNAPNANVNYYSDGGNVQIIAIKNQSFHAFGKVDYVEIQQGHFVAEATAEIKVVAAAAGATIDAPAENVQKTYEDVTNFEEIEQGATLFAGGTGVLSDPYLIEDVEDLLNINAVYGEDYKYFKVKDGVETIDCANIAKAAIKFNGSFDGNGVKLVNLAYELFNVAGFENEEFHVVIKNVDATMNTTAGRAFVRNIYTSGSMTFENVKIHGYIEGDYNLGSFYNYGTANLGGSDGCDYTVKFINSTSDATIVCPSGNGIGGMIGHGYEGAGNTLTIEIDANSKYTGKMYTANGSVCDKLMYMASNTSTFILNGVTVSGYDKQFDYASTALTVVKAEKVENKYEVAIQSNVSYIKVQVNAQITAYDEDGIKIPNLAGMTWNITEDKMTDLGEKAVVYTADFEGLAIVNNAEEETSIGVEGGVLTLHTGTSTNYASGRIYLAVYQYDVNDNIIAVGTITIAEIPDIK